MSPAPWWTPADQAEFDVAVRAYVAMVATHDSCPDCQERARVYGADSAFRFCDRVGAATDALVEWVEFRHLRSKADWLRRRHLLGALNLVGQTEAA